MPTVRELEAVQVRAPDLAIDLVLQRNTRVAVQSYHYERQGFSAAIEVDDHGLLVRSGDLWERVAVSDS